MTYFSRDLTVSDLLFFLQTMIQEDPKAADMPVAFLKGTESTPVTTLRSTGLWLGLEGGLLYDPKLR
jgi:hypothetical protein